MLHRRGILQTHSQRISTTLRGERGARVRQGVPQRRGPESAMQSRRPRADSARRAASIIQSPRERHEPIRLQVRTFHRRRGFASASRLPPAADASRRPISRDSEPRAACGLGDVRPGVRRVGRCVRPDSAQCGSDRHRVGLRADAARQCRTRQLHRQAASSRPVHRPGPAAVGRFARRRRPARRQLHSRQCLPGLGRCGGHRAVAGACPHRRCVGAMGRGLEGRVQGASRRLGKREGPEPAPGGAHRRHRPFQPAAGRR